ncbi:MAG: alcohol dehydrogenase catalytic domain-containing protein [Pirellulales bacterium]|nr:alcohol dehydrogenase catalytic domain-containing protein [Pirellulales bacterium]
MRQAVMTEPGVIQVRDVPTPVPGPDEVLLRIRRIGICGSDMHVYHGVQPFTKYPVVQGHEFSGVIEALGEGVEHFSPGTKATARPQVVCGRCRPCRRGDYNICDSLKVQGFQAPGCAQDLFVTRAERVVPLPESFTFEQGAIVEPTAVAVRAVEKAGNLAEKNAVVLGAGPIGNLVAQAARAAGARVLVTDVSDYRLQIARKCSLENVSHAKQETLADAARRVFGEDGFDVAFECVGVEGTITEAVANIAKGGRIIQVGIYPEKPRVDLSLVQDRELSLIGSLMYKHADYQQAAALIGQGKILTAPLESKHFPLEDYLSAYQYIIQQAGQCMKVFIDL